MIHGRFMTPAIWAFALISFVGCRQRSEASDPKAQQFARKILGPAADYRAIEAKADQLNQSMVQRREHAWKVVAEAMRPVEVDLGEFGPRTLASWQTWYDRTEFKRLFEILYRCELTSRERELFKDPTSPVVIDEERVNKVLAEFPRQDIGTAWTEGRFRELLSQLKSNSDLAGLNGVDGTGMSLYSPALVGHYMRHASAVFSCESSVEPAPGAPDAIGDCFGKPFPAAAVAVKPTFNKVQSGAMAFDTSAKGMTRTFKTPGEFQNMWRTAATPNQPVVNLDGDAGSNIYKVIYRQGDTVGGTFALTGLHITTKEIPEWVWVSLWWSSRPNEDYGADRPADLVDRIDPIYANYKMCVATTFEEQDPLITGTEPSTALPKSLLDTLRATHKQVGPASWCSNPFIEHMPHGAKTNCIGCHQHGGPEGMPTATKTKPSDLLKTRRSFPGDFMASFHGGKDDFQGIIQEVVSNADIEGEELDRSLCLSPVSPE